MVKNHCSREAVSKVCFADAKGSTTSSQSTRRYARFYVMTTCLTCNEINNFLVKYSRRKSLIDDVFVTYVV
jgi:hypothetical protein